MRRLEKFLNRSKVCWYIEKKNKKGWGKSSNFKLEEPNNRKTCSKKPKRKQLMWFCKKVNPSMMCGPKYVVYTRERLLSPPGGFFMPPRQSRPTGFSSAKISFPLISLSFATLIGFSEVLDGGECPVKMLFPVSSATFWLCTFLAIVSVVSCPNVIWLRPPAGYTYAFTSLTNQCSKSILAESQQCVHV